MFSDSCICVGYEGEDCDFQISKIAVARKEHTCCECGEKIKPGTKYEYVRGRWGDEFSTYKTCLICVAVRKDFFNCGFYFGTVWEYLHDIWGDDAHLLGVSQR